MVRIAAVGDIHVRLGHRGRWRGSWTGLAGVADVLLLAGDLTGEGTVEEAEILIDELRDLPVPAMAVLGNHDYHENAEAEITRLLREAGVTILEGDGVVVEVGGGRLGVAAVKGFGGGFAGRCCAAYGEQEMKAFAGHTVARADQLRAALSGLGPADAVVALTHYAPVPETLAGEPLELYPFLGSYLLGEAIDAAHVDLAIHGHAHLGTECGVTPGGVPVRNVAHAVIGRPYAVYDLPLPAADIESRRGTA